MANQSLLRYLLRSLMRYSSNIPRDRNYTVQHLRSCEAQLAAITDALTVNPHYEPLQFKADITNAYRHLNHAWNSRTWSAHRLSPKRSAASQARDSKTLERLPTDIALHDPYGDKPTPSYDAAQLPLALPKEIDTTLYHLHDCTLKIRSIANDLRSNCIFKRSLGATIKHTFTESIARAYHHLNYAWNSRHLEGDKSWGSSDDEFYQLREMPVDIGFDATA
jgi:hypothetical protein